MICRRLVSASVSVDNQTERVQAEMVSGNYFSMLGVKPAIGRVFSSQEDDRVYQGHPVVVLSYDYWVNRFARDPNVIGKKILVNNYPMTVVGVSAAGFAGMDPIPLRRQLWVHLSTSRDSMRLIAWPAKRFQQPPAATPEARA